MYPSLHLKPLIVLSILIFPLANLLLGVKWIDCFLTLTWLLVSLAALSALLNGFLSRFVSKAWKKVLLLTLTAIFLIDFLFKAFMFQNWGQILPNGVFLLAVAETNVLETTGFMQQYYPSIVRICFVGLASFVLFCFAWHPRVVGVLEALMRGLKKLGAGLNKLFQPLVVGWRKTWALVGQNSLLVRLFSPVRWLYRKKLVWPLLWVLLHFQPHTNAEPFSAYYELARVYQQNVAELESFGKDFADANGRLADYGVKAELSQPKTLVFVIGESASSFDWQIFGYPRPTNPEILKRAEQEPASFLFIQNARTEAVGTVPTLQRFFHFHHTPEQNPWSKIPGVIAIANHAGYKTFWLSNQINLGTYNNYMGALGDQSSVKKFFNNSTQKDGVLLPEFLQALNDPAPYKFIIIHLMGSHLPYRERFPSAFKKFGVENLDQDKVRKDMVARGLDEETFEQRDSFDNSILYTDFLLSQILDSLHDKKGTALLYISDHGQEVAHEGGKVGHIPTEAGYNVPMFLWWGKDFTPARPKHFRFTDNPWHLPIVDKKYLSTDLPYSLLYLLGIDIRFYDPSKNLLDPRFSQSYPFPIPQKAP